MDTSASNSLIRLTVRDAAQKIRQGEITSQDLVGQCLDLINLRDSEISAWVHINPQATLAEASRADNAARGGASLGPLHGVPVGIKDIIDTTDFPTEHGCPIFENNCPTDDAHVVRNLRNAGAIVLGKTVTTELALLTPASTKNPANVEHCPGGSSAGSAAAVACQMVPAALGTQTAGSILRPASYCGVVGFKPTLGLVPRNGVLMQSHTLDTVGVLAQNIGDAALLTGVIAAGDRKSGSAADKICADLLGFSENSFPDRRPKFAFVKTPVWDQVEGDSAQLIEDLAHRLGGACDEIEIDALGKITEWHRVVHLAENAAYYGPLQDKDRDKLSEGLNARLEEGAKVSARAYIEAVAMQDAASRGIEREIFSKYTTIMTPAAAGVAPKGFSSTGTPIFNGLWTYLGFPAVSIPYTEVDGLPLGVQLVGVRGSDVQLLQDAQWLADFISGSDEK